ncbi:LacI family DNA-binding transcriptional regulator, partial [Mycobacterium tuberculosis]|nr:LacI family DNA-binding transcriptional regulator [Mycobacterium tuberculosis]
MGRQEIPPGGLRFQQQRSVCSRRGADRTSRGTTVTDSQPTTTRPATISDVAREAGTGKTSVSRYLNGETHVLSTDLRQRI